MLGGFLRWYFMNWRADLPARCPHVIAPRLVKCDEEFQPLSC